MSYRRKILSASIIAGLCFAANGYAQTVPAVATPDGAAAEGTGAGAGQSSSEPTQMEPIIVTGIRESLKKSLDTKRIANSHVEVITAEDIGKMPDKNVADSLMRIPGVTTSSASANEGGFDENDRVSMRGTNPSLTQTLIDGHSVSSGDWFVLNQTGTVGRSVTYTLLPSEIVGEVIVHKTAQASDVEGGVAGYVDIQTRKPLDFRNPVTVDASIGGVYADLPSKTEPQFSGLVNFQNDDKTFGLLVQAFYEKRELRRDGQEALGYEQIKPDSPVAQAHPDLANVYYPILLGSALFTQQRERKGGMIDLEFKPREGAKFDLTAFDSKLNASNYNRNYLLWGTHFIAQGTGQAPDPGYVVRNGTLVSANFSAVPGTQYGIYDQISRPDESSQTRFVNLDGEFSANDALVFKGKLGTTWGNGRTPTQDVGEWNAGIGSGASYQFFGTNTAAHWALGNESPSAGPPSLSWIFGDQNINVRDRESYAQLDGIYQIGNGALTDLKFGGRYSDHTRKSSGVIGQGPQCSDGAAFDWGADFFCTNPLASPFNPANFPSGLSYYPSDFGSGIGSGFPANVWYYTQTQLAAYDSQFTNRDPVSRADWTGDFSLKEKDSAVYLQADFDGEGWGGNVGVRVVRTEENVISNVGTSADTPGAITSSAFGPYLPTRFDNSYTDVLPSANIKFDLQDDLLLRLAAATTMTRPDYSALAAPINLVFQPEAPGATTGSGSGSNPNLKPIKSNNFDASLEYYFAPRALLSASVFYLDLTSYIGFGSVTRTFKTFNQNYPQGFDAQYVLTVPVNSSGSVKGFELAYEQPFLDNFGVALNYTYADGSEKGGGPLVGTSKNTYNASAYYEDDHFNARVSYTYRSSFYSGLDRSTAFYQDGVGALSASLGYKLNDMWSFSLDALNLNDPELKYYAVNRDRPRAFYVNGRQYYFTVHFKF
jgi:iron complex outermembrane recepter protein